MQKYHVITPPYSSVHLLIVAELPRIVYLLSVGSTCVRVTSTLVEVKVSTLVTSNMLDDFLNRKHISF